MNILPKFLSHLMDKIEAKWFIYQNLRRYKSEIHSKTRMHEIKAVHNSCFFEAQYYRETYQLDMDDLSLAAYYTYVGYRQGHNPSPSFSGKGYYWLRPDVRKYGMNPLLHYENYGFREGVKPISVLDFERRQISDADIAEIMALKKQGKVVLLISHEMSLTGAPRALLNLAVTLKNLGVEPVFSTLIPGDLEIEVNRSGLRYKLLMMQSMDQDSDFSEEIIEYISLFDMILFNTIVALPLVENIKSLTLPKVCWIHDGSYGFGCCSSSSRFSALYPLFDKIFVVGDYAKKIAVSYGDTNIEMENLYYGIDDLSCNACVQPKQSSVTMVLAGTIEKRKGQDILLDSLALLTPEILKQLKIIIIGKALDANMYNQLKKNKFECIEMLGVIPHEQILKHFTQMDILLCPSIDDPMPIVCTEAMMLSKPVIVSDHTGTASFIHDGENGYVVQANNPKSLAEAIIRSVEAKSELPVMGKRARKVFEDNFTNEIFENNVKEKFLPYL